MRTERVVVRGVLIVLAVLAAPPALLVLGAVSAHLTNEWRLARFADQLFEFAPPDGARVVDRAKEVGLLTGNGNHCDFLVRQELASALPLEAVRAHYARLPLRHAHGDGPGGPPILDVEIAAPGRYAVTILDAPYSAGLDFRCR